MKEFNWILIKFWPIGNFPDLSVKNEREARETLKHYCFPSTLQKSGNGTIFPITGYNPGKQISTENGPYNRPMGFYFGWQRFSTGSTAPEEYYGWKNCAVENYRAIPSPMEFCITRAKEAPLIEDGNKPCYTIKLENDAIIYLPLPIIVLGPNLEQLAPKIKYQRESELNRFFDYWRNHINIKQ
ncbi:MAG: hypothetical protein FWC51_01005 [Proteobacteria bacterium]|nr:hypothetical protein [Pseudomonadota bacterium]